MGLEGEYLTDRLTNESIKLIKGHDKISHLLCSYHFIMYTLLLTELEIFRLFRKKIIEMDDNSVRTKKVKEMQLQD